VGMAALGPELDAARARVAEGGLTAQAVSQLTPVVSGLSLEALAPVKQLIKRFFSRQPWTDGDDDALAAAVGFGTGNGRHELEPGLTLVWGFEEGRFLLRLEHDDPAAKTGQEGVATSDDMGELFDGVVAPEATPSPRAVRFTTPPLHTGPSRVYETAAEAAADPRVTRLFGDFDEVTNVLVGPNFVAVTVSHPDRWAALLAPVLRAVTEEFTGEEDRQHSEPEAPVVVSLQVGRDDPDTRAPRRLERAWTELGMLRPDQAEHLDRVLAATRDAEPARRQVAATLLADAPPDAARRAWERLLDDPSRGVRRSVVDAIAGAARQELRPLLERALDDSDAWTRWKALRGIADLGTGPSRAAVLALASDPDFRVRLEAARIATRDPA
jgi:hypothetical protein